MLSEAGSVGTTPNRLALQFEFVKSQKRFIPKKFRCYVANLRIQGRMRIFEKESRKCCNWDFASTRRFIHSMSETFPSIKAWLTWCCGTAALPCLRGPKRAKSQFVLLEISNLFGNKYFHSAQRTPVATKRVLSILSSYSISLFWGTLQWHTLLHKKTSMGNMRDLSMSL